MKSIVIHGSQQKPEASTSTAKVNFRKPHEVTEFEDFSTTLPTKLLKRSSHVADTSSLPPSKRMKTSPTKEPIQVETANMHKDYIQTNESEKHVSPDNVPAAKSAVGDDFDQTFHVVEQQQASTGLEVHNFANKSDPPQQNDQSNVQEDIKGPEPSTMIKQVDNISEQNISSDILELFDQQVSSDTLKEDEPSVKIQKVDDVSEHNIVADMISTVFLLRCISTPMEPQRADTDQLIPNSDTLQNTGKKDGRVAVDETDKVEEQVEEIEKEKIKPSTSESNTSAPFSTETLDVIDALIYGLPSNQVVQDECLLRDSHLPTTLPSKPNVLSDDAKTPFRRSRIPSKILQSPYLSNFGSSKKGKEKLSSVMHQAHPFEGFGICYHPPSELFTDYSQWINKGLLKSHGNKKPKEDHYRSKYSSFGFEKIDFVVAFPKDKNWFYLMSQPNRCWNDEHIDIIFYYLQKKSKMQLSNQYRYTTTNCIFKIYIEYAHTRYYHIPPDISTQEDMARATVTAHHERFVKNIIRGFSIPAELPWHLVDEVYIPVNCDRDFHWVLAVVVLKKRLIRVYDSSPRRKSSNPFLDRAGRSVFGSYGIR
ncbi:uncharacterized protein LOC129898850 [Solanum dulcamara]|uniref:uncharacterized protein LOC129898850 n=1 Tax=Solanum dulcamara TaxID=45834 RepID=UPI0024856BD7|nr:uncharacterized protein LOC129898850 [Solanum dulcamara]